MNLDTWLDKLMLGVNFAYQILIDEILPSPLFIALLVIVAVVVALSKIIQNNREL